jgi:hypothetical protein
MQIGELFHVVRPNVARLEWMLISEGFAWIKQKVNQKGG